MKRHQTGQGDQGLDKHILKNPALAGKSPKPEDSQGQGSPAQLRPCDFSKKKENQEICVMCPQGQGLLIPQQVVLRLQLAKKKKKGGWE